ncbi:hypothetical protein CBS101457_006940 [Exobasidium rhododendri]|nr:hypothetical protein CBS101457_006940 [Exobasidium rhododendri]
MKEAFALIREDTSDTLFDIVIRASHLKPVSYSQNTLQALSSPSPLLIMRSQSGSGRKAAPIERRQTHNTVERARRESLNDRFLELASKMPSTRKVQRPSKVFIIEKSLEFVHCAYDVESGLRHIVTEIINEKQRMMKELNEYRVEQGLLPRSSSVEADLVLPQRLDPKHTSDCRLFPADDDNFKSPESTCFDDSTSHYAVSSSLSSSRMSSQEHSPRARLSLDGISSSLFPFNNTAGVMSYIANPSESFQAFQSAIATLATPATPADSFYTSDFSQSQLRTRDLDLSMMPISAANLNHLMENNFGSAAINSAAGFGFGNSLQKLPMDRSNRSIFASVEASGLLH